MSRWRDYLRGFCNVFAGAEHISLFPAKLDGYPRRSEADALRSDWETVGGDMRKVMGDLDRAIRSAPDGELQHVSERSDGAQTPLP